MGGEFRKWYGNFLNVVNWENDGEELRRFPRAGVTKTKYFFRIAISWTDISSSYFGVRYIPQGCIGGNTSPSIYPDPNQEFYLCGMMTSKVASYFLKFLSPTMHNNVGDITKLPIILDEAQKPHIDALVEENIALSKTDWDSFETSWDFRKHPLV